MSDLVWIVLIVCGMICFIAACLACFEITIAKIEKSEPPKDSDERNK